MKTVPLIRKHTLALAIGSALLTPFAGYAASGQQLADGVHLDVAAGDYATNVDNQSALVARNAGSINAAGANVITQGQGAYGAIAKGGARLDLIDTVIDTTGDYAPGVSAESGSAINATNVDVTTSGYGAAGATANGAGSTINIHGGSYATSGVFSQGVSASNGGVVVIDRDPRAGEGTLIHTTGASSRGIAANNGTIIVNGATIKTEGNKEGNLGADGALATNGGSVVLTDSTIETSGSFANGIYAETGGSFGMSGGAILTKGQGSTGAALYNGGTGALSSVNIRTEGNNARGVVSRSAGSAMSVSNSAITTMGAGSYGAHTLEGARADLIDTTIETSGDSAHGIYVQSGGTVNATRVDIATSGNNAHGVLVNGAGSLVDYQGGAIQTAGMKSHGIFASGGGHVGATGVAIHTTGDQARGVQAQGSTVELVGVSIKTEGNRVDNFSAAGVVASGDSTIKLTDSRIETTGYWADGMVAEDAGSSIEMVGGSILTTGDKSQGVVAYGGDTSIALTNVAIRTEGESGRGIVASGVLGDVASSVSMTGGSVLTTGDNATGVHVGSGAVANLNGTHVRTEGAGSWGAQVNGTLNIAGGSLVSVQHGAINATGDATIALSNGAQAIGGNGTLLSIADEDSTVSLSMDNNVYAEGDIVGVDTNGDGTQNVNAQVALSNASHWKGATDGSVNQLSLDSGSQWTMTGDSMVGQLSLNDSVIAFAAPTVGDFKTLTVAGDFASNGGTLLMNTVLGDDRSATDKLHVLGNTSGQANVAVNNVGGVGAQTVDGIQIIQVDGASNAQFDLSGRAVGGLYEYFLFKGGKADPNDGDWYLRSELPVVPPDPCEVDPNAPGCTPVIPPDPCEVDPNAPGCTPVIPPDPCEVDPNAPGCTPVIPDPCEVDPNAPGCKPIDPPPAPVLRPEVGAYLANQAAAIGLFQHAMHDRLGEPNLAERLKNDDNLGSAWARMERNQADYGAVEGQIDVNSDSSLLQIGTDIAQWGQTSRGQIGIMAAVGQANSTATSELTGYAAKGKVEGTALGVYGSWFANPAEATGAYVDTWVQAAHYKNSVHGEGLAKESYEAESLTGSVEAGYAWKVYADDAKAFYLEPQAQVSYTDYRSNDHMEANGTVVSAEQAGGLTTRLGLRAYGHATSAQGNRVQPFVTANWYHQSDANAVAFDGEALTGGVPQDRYEVKVGAQLQLGGGWAGWGQMGVQSGAGDYRNVGGQLGLKYSW